MAGGGLFITRYEGPGAITFAAKVPGHIMPVDIVFLVGGVVGAVEREVPQGREIEDDASACCTVRLVDCPWICHHGPVGSA
jgi:hypothetical protein